MSDAENWLRFEGYEGRVDPGYRGNYASLGFRLPYVERTRTWDIVRVDGEPIDRRYARNQFTVVSRGHDMMGKANEELAAYRRHFLACVGVGRCMEIGHPGGPRRSMAQALVGAEATPLRSEPAPTSAVPAAARPTRSRQRLAPPTDAAMNMQRHAWTAGLEPIGPVVMRSLTDDVAVPVVPLEFALWTGPPLGMAEDCNKRGDRVVGDQGELSCAEVEIVKRLRRAGWNAAWVCPFHCGARRWSVYRSEPTHLPASVLDVERRVGMGQAGRPDAVAWTADRVVYVESKSTRDKVRPTQIAWYRAAYAANVQIGDIVIVEWRPTVEIA